MFASSFLTTTFISPFDEPSSYDSSPIYISTGWGYWSWTNPFSVGRDLVRAALRIIQDETGGLFDPDAFSSLSAPESAATLSSPGIVWRFVRRIILGLPVVGAASIIHMLLSLPLLGPLQWIARSRGNRGRRGSGSADAAAIVIIFLLAVGALR